MPDAMSSMFFAAGTSAIVLFIGGAMPEVLLGAALSGAFLAGMKPTYVVVAALFGFAIILVGAGE